MRNIADKIVEKINIFCVQWHFFPKILPFVRQCGKIWYRQTAFRGRDWSPSSGLLEPKQSVATCSVVLIMILYSLIRSYSVFNQNVNGRYLVTFVLVETLCVTFQHLHWSKSIKLMSSDVSTGLNENRLGFTGGILWMH